MEFRVVVISVFLFGYCFLSVMGGTIGSKHFYNGIEQDNRRIVDEDELVPIEIVLTDNGIRKDEAAEIFQREYVRKALEEVEKEKPMRPPRKSCIGAVSLMALCY